MQYFTKIIMYVFSLLLSLCILSTNLAIATEPSVHMQILRLSTLPEPVLAIEITSPEKQYIYAYDDTYALPLRISLAGGLSIQYPESQERQDLLDPKQRVRVYDKPTSIFVTLPERMWNSSVDMTLSFLMCSPTACTPFKHTYTVSIPKAAPLLEASPWLEAYKKAIHKDSLQSATPEKAITKASNVPLQAWGVRPQASVQASETLWQFTPRETNTLFIPTNLLPAMLLGLLAGLILNVMPCVLPVITIKLTALLSATKTIDPHTARRHFREHNALFAAGIVVYFVLLALFMGLSGLAWGSLFQIVPVVFVLLIIVFSLALSMFGVFILPAPRIKAISSQNAHVQSFATGFFVTLLATPCSGPLLGGVLGWAATQSLPSLVMVFLATGFGMASPYFLLTLFPSAIRFLPKPGAWVRIFEYIVGFFLMGTSVYLLSILPESMIFPSLSALIVIAFALWLWGQWGYLAPARQQAITGCCALLLIGISIGFVFMPEDARYAVPSFTEKTFKATLGKQPVMLIFTADWCPTCKVLEQSVLTPDALEKWEKQYNLAILEVDITKHDPKDMALLRALNSVSIPLVAIFPQGEDAYEPYILRDFFTQSTITQVLQSIQHFP